MEEDWELLHTSETKLTDPTNSLDISKDFVEIDGVSEVIINSDYFGSKGVSRVAEIDEESGSGSVGSDNPSWIEPCSRDEFGPKDSGEFWSDSSGDEFDGKQEVGVGDYGNREVGFEGIGEIEGEMEEKAVKLDREVMVSGEGEEKELVWWKVPFEIMKFCLFKISPGWSIAFAAAVMGVVIMRRRLYKMKMKSRSVALKITVEDKKVSQFMKNAAQLNEAFSVVRRAPIIRPLLPPTGLTPWPVMSLY